MESSVPTLTRTEFMFPSEVVRRIIMSLFTGFCSGLWQIFRTGEVLPVFSTSEMGSQITERAVIALPMRQSCVFAAMNITGRKRYLQLQVST